MRPARVKIQYEITELQFCLRIRMLILYNMYIHIQTRKCDYTNSHICNCSDDNVCNILIMKNGTKI